MYGERIEIEAEMIALSPLHIGSAQGETRPIGIEDGTTEVARIQKDARDAPILPGSSVKGALRALASACSLPEAVVVELFGEPLNDEAPSKTTKSEGDRERSGRPGRLTVRAADFVSAGPMGERQERIEDRLSFDGHAYGWITSRTAIDDVSGTADGNKLFRAEVVAPGATFLLRLTFAGTVADLQGPAGDALVTILSAMKHPEGFALGRGKGDGWGRLRLGNDAGSAPLGRVERIGLDRFPVGPSPTAPDGSSLAEDLNRRIEHKKIGVAARPRWVLELDTTEPFLVKVEKPKPPKKADDKGANNRLVAMRDGGGLPELPGSSFMGALRARAEWFAGLNRIRSDGRSVDQPVARQSDEPSDPIHRLFGQTADDIRDERDQGHKRTGWAGLLRIVSLKYTGAEKPRRKTLASVRIDRFSAEPFGGGLFFVDAFVEPKFRVVLELDASRTVDRSDIAFVRDLLAWMSERKPGRGIDLGHGVNRGFGWFGVKVTEGPQA